MRAMFTCMIGIVAFCSLPSCDGVSPNHQDLLGKTRKDVEKALGEPNSVSTIGEAYPNPAEHTQEEIEAWNTNTIYQVLYYPRLVVKINENGIVVSVEKTK